MAKNLCRNCVKVTVVIYPMVAIVRVHIDSQADREDREHPCPHDSGDVTQNCGFQLFGAVGILEHHFYLQYRKVKALVILSRHPVLII